MKKEMTIILSTIFLMVFTSGCSFSSAILLPTEFQKNIYNETDKIIQEDSYTFIERKGYYNKGFTGLEFRGFYGSNTLESMEISETSIVNIDFDANIEEGMFKVVLITPDKEVLKISENTEKGSYKILAPEGKYTIKIVGKGASGKMVIKTSRMNILSG